MSCDFIIIIPNNILQIIYCKNNMLLKLENKNPKFYIKFFIQHIDALNNE